MFVANDVGTVFVANSGMAARGEFVFREQDITGGSATNAHLWFVKGVVANDFAAFRTKNEMRRVSILFITAWAAGASARTVGGSGAGPVLATVSRLGSDHCLEAAAVGGTQSSEAGSVASPIEG